MRYAEVSVNAPLAQRRTFSYGVPSGLEVVAGQVVWVPFGERTLQGIVTEFVAVPAVAETRDILAVTLPEIRLSQSHLELARWMSDHYLCPLFDALALMLPPGFSQKPRTFLSIPQKAENTSEMLPETQASVLEYVRSRGRASAGAVEKHFGQKKGRDAVRELVRQNILQRSYEVTPPRIKAKHVPYLRLAVSHVQALKEAEACNARRATRQASLMELLVENPYLDWAQARKKSSGTRAALDAIVARGLVTIENISVKRLAVAVPPVASPPLSPTADQQAALTRILAGLETGHERVFLLRGVTGSGKTEIYLQALASVLEKGRRGIVLVPEIALTPQTIERFSARFPGRVAVLHSQLTPGEHFDEWHRIRDGEADVVIGPRSALFAPLAELGLIVIDEEHEWTYKQTEPAPRYHTRDAAIRLAELTGAGLVMGSATPDVATYHGAVSGRYGLLELGERVVPIQGAPLPPVTVVDMRQELKEGNYSVFSRPLQAAVYRALAMGQQIILFLNRRGSANLVQCRHCGFILRCKRCQIPFTYHGAEEILRCHQCGARARVPAACPRCSRRQLRFLGVGTQKLEGEVSHHFPQARWLRWDSDVTSRRYDHERILNRFRSHQADILIGTQMVAKGLDLPGVTVVGVVSADTSLALPDIRAGERTFQLLSQVAGRAGRGAAPGEVIIQTFSPEHYAITAAAGHDYGTFYEKEIAYRQRFRYPPFAELAQLVYSHTNKEHAREEGERLARVITAQRDALGLTDLDLIGPTPAFIERRRGRFRWQIILRGRELATFLAGIPLRQEWTVDIDPVSLI